MKPLWGDLDARARGLSTHLLSRGELTGLAQLSDIGALAEALRSRGYPLEDGETSPAGLELAVRRAAAHRVRVIARWSGPRAAALTVLFEDEDRRSLRALIRGAVEGASGDARMAGLVPTPNLPERALGELAQQRTPGAIAALLTAWHNPYGSPLLAAASAALPDLFRLELVLTRTFASRAGQLARRTPLLATYVRDVLDIENACAALVLARGGGELLPKDAFVPGGAHISIREFELAAAANDVPQAARLLASAFEGTPFGAVFGRGADDPAGLEDALLRARIRDLARAARTQPLGPAPLLGYWLRLRAETVDLRRIIWGVALAAPPGALAQDLVTA